MMVMVMRPRLSAFFLPAMATLKGFEQRARLRVVLLFRSHVGLFVSASVSVSVCFFFFSLPLHNLQPVSCPVCLYCLRLLAAGRGWLGFRGEEDLPSAEPSLLGN